MKSELIIGQKYGHLTPLLYEGRGKHHEPRYLCRCDCGSENSFNAYQILKGTSTHCRDCRPSGGGIYRTPDIVGKQINGWDVLELVSNEPKVNKTGPNYLFRCRCLRCGNEAIRSAGQIRHKRSDRCENCPPMYNFQINGDVATGTLPNGVPFIIDAEDIPRFEQFFWVFNRREGYVRNRRRVKLHRFLLNVTDPNIIVDHINRDRLDNRKANLRIVTWEQNTCNHSKLSSNASGYIGVYFSQSSQRYEVKVGYHGKRILLGSSKADLVSLAQMYNVAARYLFGEYVGELNDVPDAPPDLQNQVIQKCKKYKEAPVPEVINTDAIKLEVA